MPASAGQYFSPPDNRQTSGATAQLSANHPYPDPSGSADGGNLLHRRELGACRSAPDGSVGPGREEAVDFLEDFAPARSGWCCAYVTRPVGEYNDCT